MNAFTASSEDASYAEARASLQAPLQRMPPEGVPPGDPSQRSAAKIAHSRCPGIVMALNS